MQYPDSVVRLLRRAKTDPSLYADPDVFCLECGGVVQPRDIDGVQMPSHECCACRDAGRVLVNGKAEICRACLAPLNPDKELRRRGFPAEFWTADLALVQTGMSGGAFELQAWATLWPNREQNVLLMGPVGAGKTYAAVALCRALLATKQALPLYTSTVGLLQRLRDTMKPVNADTGDGPPETEALIMGAMKRVPVLVLDDVGREQGTDWAQSRLFDIVDYRWSHHMTTIATANQEMFANLPSAMRSRLGSGLVVTFDGLPDRRTGAPSKPKKR